jgi:hypothetical protein
VDMSTVVMHNVVSVDGYIADEADQVGPLFDWYFNGDTALTKAASSRFRGHRPSTSGRCGTASARW